MLYAQAVASGATLLDDDMIRGTLSIGLSNRYDGAKVLVLIPDHTRSLPLPLLFRYLTEALANTKQLDFMVALGTHPPLSEQALLDLVGIAEDEKAIEYKHVNLLNHNWQDPDALVAIGLLPKSQIQQIAGDYWHESLGDDVPVRINKHALAYDEIIILGPTFPHEVVGFSGGAKYLFPGISGPEMIDVTHWLGALIGSKELIGVADTPVRRMIHTAAEFVTTPITLISLVVVDEGLAGLFIGDHLSAWRAAAKVSSEQHIVWLDEPVQQVLSHAPPMYDELWVAAKAMYKLEPAVADGGELIIFAPHLKTVSVVHSKHIFEVGYHVRDYFLQQWDQFKHIPLGVLAHSTHVRGAGSYDLGMALETPRINVSLASQISRADCERLNLGYKNALEIDLMQWMGQAEYGILYVPKAGEKLYRVRGA